MKTFDGYSKEKFSDTSVLLAGGGSKELSNFIGTLNWDSTNRKLQYKKIGDTNWSDLVTFGSNATNSTAYLPLAGGTMTGVITSSFASSSWINGVTNAVIKGTYIGYGAILSMPVKDGRVSLSSYPASNNNIYFGYATTALIKAGTNSFNKQIYWDAANNNLYADVFTGSLVGNASTATKLTSSAGSAVLPVYFSDGKPIACTAYSELLTALSSSADTNLSITVGGTTKSITNLYSGYLKIHDIRGTAHTPNATYYPEKLVTAWFNNTGTPTSDWYSGIHVKGWSNGYTSWELCSYSSTGTANNYNLYFRSGNNTTWGSWKTILDSSNYSSYALPLSGGTCTGNIYAPHFYESSDIRQKTDFSTLIISTKELSTIPLFDFSWKEDHSSRNTGTSAQAVQSILPNLVTESGDYLKLDYGVLGTIAGITACKELVALKSEIELLKERIKELELQLKIINDY